MRWLKKSRLGIGTVRKVALTPFWIFLEGSGKFMIENFVLTEDGFGDGGGGLGEDAVHFHRGTPFPNPEWIANETK